MQDSASAFSSRSGRSGRTAVLSEAARSRGATLKTSRSGVTYVSYPYKPKPRQRLLHQGYGPDGIPLAPAVIMIPGERPKRAVSMSVKAQTARARLADGSATAEWRAFLAQHKGKPRDWIVATWRLTHPKRTHLRKGEELFRYERLRRQAKALGVAPVWHTSRGVPPPRFPKRWASVSVAGHPYGSVWSDAEGLHGSGMAY